MKVCPLVSSEWLGDVNFETQKGSFFLRWLLISLITGCHSLLSLCRKLILNNLDFRNSFYSLAERIVSDNDFTLDLVLPFGLENYHLAFMLRVGVRSQHVLKRHLLLN